jgi:non-specific protein-tyrosine kinase
MNYTKSIKKVKPMFHITEASNLNGTFEDRKAAGWAKLAHCEIQCFDLDREKAKENRCVCIRPDAEELDFYKILRTRIKQQCKEKGWNTVMITSALPGEGKTLTSINLALTFAKELADPVLLVDCDLRRQNIYQYLGFSSDKGLIDNLAGDFLLGDLIIRPGVENFHVISGGRTINDSTEMLSSHKMKTAIVEMKKRYKDRYVFFDVPPILSTADAIAFSPLVDCILMVVQAERTTTQDIRKVLEMIPKDKFLGFVLNRQRSPIKGDYKYH